MVIVYENDPSENSISQAFEAVSQMGQSVITKDQDQESEKSKVWRNQDTRMFH